MLSVQTVGPRSAIMLAMHSANELYDQDSAAMTAQRDANAGPA